MRIISQAAWPGFFVVAALVLACPSSVRAATWNVPSQIATIAAALDSADAGDVVSVACGTYLEHGLVLHSGVRLESVSGHASCVTIDGQGVERILDCVGSDAEVVAITFQGGNATTPGNFDNGGGAIRVVDVSVSIVDCVFTANSATFGGAIGLLRSASVVSGCAFTNNTATSPAWAVGGAVYCEQDSPVLEGCTFTGNTAFSVAVPGDGGAVFAKWTRLRITDGTFIDNHAGAGAGAFYSFNDDRSELVRCHFEANGALAGGATYLERSEASFVECTFTGNVAESGGATYVEVFSTPTFVRCDFRSNESTAFAGGAIDTWFSTPEFTECRFLDNVSSIDGGAVTLNGLSSASFWGCVFGRNVAAQDGGAVRVRQTASATITNSTFVGNEASGVGGALFVEGSGSIDVDESLVAFSAGGGAAACAGSGVITFECSNVFGNVGGDWVGCLAPQAFSHGNFEADPWICDLAGDTFGVSQPESPCLPENNACAVLVGASGVGCGCPVGATVLVPTDFPTIAAALAASAAGDVIGVCGGTWTEAIDVRDGVHLLGMGPGLTRLEWPLGSPSSALVRARGVADSTVVEGFTLDGLGAAPSVVAAESTSTGLRLRSNVIRGGFEAGVRNGPDSFVRIGGTLAFANDILENGAVIPRSVWNENVTADSLEALLNYWGTQAYDVILDSLEGPVRTCPITEITHTLSLCAPPSALSAPESNGAVLELAIGPSPFRSQTVVTFAPGVGGADGRVRIYDVRGRHVVTLFDGRLSPGPTRAVWTGRDQGGRSVAPGVYFVRLEAGDRRLVRKVIRLR